MNNFSLNLEDCKPGGRLISGDLGYDEYAGTLSELGLTQLLALEQAPQGCFRYIRIHNIFTSKEGDNHGARDAGGDPVRMNSDGSISFEWAMIDAVCLAILESGCIPFIELGFTPTVWSTIDSVLKSDLNNELKWKVNKNKPGSPACYPPRDLNLWANLLQAFLSHLTTEFGEEAKQWPIELWNEPDISYFKGTIKEYCELWHCTHKLCKEFGMHMVGAPAVAHAASFLQKFLSYTIESGTVPDFISFHLKAGHEPDLNKGGANLHTLWIRALTLRDAIPQELRNVPIWITEFDPITGCELGIKDDNGWSFQNKSYYPAWLGQACYMLVCLQQSRDINTLEFDPDLEPLKFDAIFNDNHHITAETTPFYGARCITTPIWVKSAEKESKTDELTLMFNYGSSKLKSFLRKIYENLDRFPSLKVALDDLSTRIYRPKSESKLKTIAKPIFRAFECIKNFQGSFSAFGNREQSIYGVLCINENDIYLVIVNQPEPIKEGAERDIYIQLKGFNNQRKVVLAESLRIDSGSANPYELWLSMGSPNEVTETEYQRLVDESVPKPVQMKNLSISDTELSFSLHTEAHSFHHLHFKLSD